MKQLFKRLFVGDKSMESLNEYIHLSREVSEALCKGMPIVSLETTIISHGMPFPKNVETAFAVEQEVYRGGALPATIGILDGKIRVGLTPAEIERFGMEGLSATKTSRRDFAYVLSKGLTGSLTVSGTMIASHLAGIPFFATGGIGGVHRHGEDTMDISADLEELSNTPVVVICAGAKSILDIGRTLEYLETGGVPVIGYETDEMPAFYTRESGYKLPMRVDTPEEAAAIYRISRSLGFPGGMVIANPIPEKDAMEKEKIDRAIADAVSKADEQGITGKDVSPFLLENIVAETGGESLAANIALVLNNAYVAAKIAAAYCGRTYVKDAFA